MAQDVAAVAAAAGDAEKGVKDIQDWVSPLAAVAVAEAEEEAAAAAAAEVGSAAEVEAV